MTATQQLAVEQDVADPGRRRLLRRGAAAAALAATAGAGWLLRPDSTPAAGAEPDTPRSTAEVEVRTLAETEEVSGTLGFADQRILFTGLTGTITEMAASGRCSTESTTGR